MMMSVFVRSSAYIVTGPRIGALRPGPVVAAIVLVLVLVVVVEIPDRLAGLTTAAGSLTPLPCPCPAAINVCNAPVIFEAAILRIS